MHDVGIDWLIVMPVPGLTTRTAPAIHQAIALIKPDRPVAVSIIDTVGDRRLGDLCASAGAFYSKFVADPFSWGYAANLGAFVCRSNKVCFLHSDITLPNGILWLDALSTALDHSSGLAAPMIEGSSPNPLQYYRGPDDVPYYHTTAYISNACFALKTPDFKRIGGFHPALCGEDWWSHYLQEMMAQHGKPTVIVPGSMIQHAGSADAGRTLKRNANMSAFCDVTNIEMEYTSRPSRVRAQRRCGASLAIIIDGMHRYEYKIDLEDYNECIIIDSEPTRAGWHKTTTLSKQWAYSPVLDEHPARLAADLAGGECVSIVDRRTSPLVIGASGKPWRYGHGYALPQHLTEVHVTNFQAGAIGDTLMMTPALTAFKRKFPWIDIHVHAHIFSGQLLLNHEAIHTVHLVADAAEIPHNAISIGRGVGREGTIAAYYHELGLPKPQHADLIQCVITAQEKLDAAQRLTKAGINTDTPVVGLQLHGKWRAKNWARVSAACRILAAKGWQVVTFGVDSERSERASMSRVMHLDGMNIREAVSVVSILDGMIGYDSGLSYAAAAVSTPLVALFGPHDPAGLICQAGGGKLIAIRKRTPQMCFEEHGRSCRTDGGIGESCPLRSGAGGRCLDEISVHQVVQELEKIAKRKP